MYVYHDVLINSLHDFMNRDVVALTPTAIHPVLALSARGFNI